MSGLDHAFIKAYDKGQNVKLYSPPLVDAVVADDSSATIPLVPDVSPPAPHRPFDRPSTKPGKAIILPSVMEQSDAEAGVATALFDTPDSAQPIEPRPAPAPGPGNRPLLQVDRFAWPDVCGSLVAAAQSEFSELAQELLARIAVSRRLLLVTSCRRSEGRTTLVLTIARLLASKGCKAAIVDADFANPQLAQELGVLPEVGFEDVLFGRMDLTDVLVESAEDRIALLPLCGPSDGPATLATWPAAAETLATLRRTYELVLVDVGPLDAKALEDAQDWPTVDGAILARDIRVTAHREVADLSRRLAAAGIAPYGIAENFVPL